MAKKNKKTKWTANEAAQLSQVQTPEQLNWILTRKAAQQPGFVSKSAKPAKVKKVKPPKLVTFKSEKKPPATKREIVSPSERDLINAVRQQISVKVAPYLPDVQSTNPFDSGYVVPAAFTDKAYTYRADNPYANSDNPVEREAGAGMAHKSATEKAADTYARRFFLHSMANSDNPRDREDAYRAMNPAAEAPVMKHVMIGSADGRLRDANTGELITGKDLAGADLPDASNLLRDEPMGGWESLRSAFGEGYDGGYRKNN